MIDIGGELLANGQKPDGEKWLVGIEKPTESADEDRELQQTFALKNSALATSGNYRKYYEIDGVRYAHSLDPKTGYPVDHSLLSVSVSNEISNDKFSSPMLLIERGCILVSPLNNSIFIESIFTEIDDEVLIFS